MSPEFSRSPEQYAGDFNTVPVSEVNAVYGALQRVRQLADEDTRARQQLPPLPSREEIEQQIELRMQPHKGDSDSTMNVGIDIAAHLEARRQVMAPYQELYERYYETSNYWLNQAIEELSELSVWQHRFSTGTKGKPQWSDSTYFMTEHGASLRLKIALLIEGGLESVKQQIADRILFVAPENNAANEGKKARYQAMYGEALEFAWDEAAVSFTPVEGHEVYEFFSLPFAEMQQGRRPLAPLTSMGVYQDNDIMMVINTASDNHHLGHTINKIEW